jgi:hypothetical protein
VRIETMNFLPAPFRWIPPLFLVVVSGVAADSSAFLPKPMDPARYESIWKKSPFTLSSAPADDLTSNAGFIEQLALVGVTRRGDSSFVAVLNKTSGERFLVDANAEGNSLGLVLVSISTEQDPNSVVVTLKKGSETGTLKFDPSLFVSANVPPPAPNTAAPNVPIPRPAWTPSGVPGSRPIPRVKPRQAILPPNQTAPH